LTQITEVAKAVDAAASPWVVEERDFDVVVHRPCAEPELVEHPRRGRTDIDVRTQHNRQRPLMLQSQSLQQRCRSSGVTCRRRAQDGPQYLVFA